MDGTGAPLHPGSIAIKSDRIVAVGDVPKAESKEIIDASGLTVSPGFIDAHSHVDKTLPCFHSG
ncbi:MAG: D-glutamate deacylase [Candidatus Bathyarchaeota archaeon BA1]|nr:MAG: D-glutamate deacylase [Candidatus Bathyarchaeota archaeon BA1]